MGLLEVDNDGDGELAPVPRVQFLHRTVRDFLLTAEMTKYISSKLKAGFEAFTSICKAYVASIKSTRLYFVEPLAGLDDLVLVWGNSGRLGLDDLRPKGHLDRIVQLVLAYSSKVPASRIADVVKIIDELERSIVLMAKTTQAVPLGHHGQTFSPNIFFRSTILRRDMSTYLSKKLLCNYPGYLSVLGAPSLFVACRRQVHRQRLCPSSWSMVRIQMRSLDFLSMEILHALLHGVILSRSAAGG
jgi:hypothetical protein